MDPDLHRMIASELYCSAVSGLRAGVPGQPFPQDLALRDKAKNVLTSISRFSRSF
jgi:hypothetical protein